MILGAGGMLGRQWADALRTDIAAGRALALDRAGCDILDAAAVERAVAPGVGVVINCAAYTDVDGAETNEALATRINADAVGIVADRCGRVGATLVHYSTDYVFDGRAGAPYAVDRARSPINAYGRSKARGEELLEGSGCGFLLLRTSWVYAAHGKNFVRTIASLCAQRPTLRVVNDQRGRPSSTAGIVATTRALLAAGARGALHACDGGECTWFDFARAIGARVNPGCDIQPCASAEFPRPAPRPAYSVLDLGPTEAVVGPLTHWREALAPVLTTILTQHAAGGAARDTA